MGRDRSRPAVRLSLPMEQPAQYPAMHQRHQLFQSAQLPPPSQLHLPIPSSSYSRSNTLPPITHIPPAQQTHSFPSINTYHPGPAVLPSLPPSPTSQHPWQTQHRTSNSREEFYPQQPNIPRSEHARPPPIVKDEPNTAHRPYPLHDPQPSSQHHPLPVKESASVEDGMPSTSDFVKKLYKWALTFATGVTSCDNRRLPLQDARGPVLPARRLVGPPGRLFCGQGPSRITHPTDNIVHRPWSRLTAGHERVHKVDIAPHVQTL